MSIPTSSNLHERQSCLLDASVSFSQAEDEVGVVDFGQAGAVLLKSIRLHRRNGFTHR